MNKQHGTAGNSSILEKANLGVSGGSPEMSKGYELRDVCWRGGLQLQIACAWLPEWRNFFPRIKQKTMLDKQPTQ